MERQPQDNNHESLNDKNNRMNKFNLIIMFLILLFIGKVVNWYICFFILFYFFFCNNDYVYRKRCSKMTFKWNFTY